MYSDARTLRRIITLKREHQKTFVGFIADQSPKWNSIHHWVPFLHRETPIFIGTEQIAKQVGAVVYFTDVKRIKRGYYHCELKRMTVHPQELPDYQLTDMYARMLEEMIQREPAYWLWSHNRWKRTKEEWERRNNRNSKYLIVLIYVDFLFSCKNLFSGKLGPAISF